MASNVINADFDCVAKILHIIVKSKNNTRKERRILRRASRQCNGGPVRSITINVMKKTWTIIWVLQKFNRVNRNNRIYPQSSIGIGKSGFEGESSHPGTFTTSLL